MSASARACRAARSCGVRPALASRAASCSRLVLRGADRAEQPEVALSLMPLVSSTENSAVPIDAATCWLMLRNVEPRAMLWSLSVASAARHDRHHRGAHAQAHDEQRGDEVEVAACPRSIWVNIAHADRDHRDAGQHDLAGADLVGEQAGDRHRQHGADALRARGAVRPRGRSRRAPPGSTAGTAGWRRRTRSRTASSRSPRRSCCWFLQQPQLDQRVDVGRAQRPRHEGDDQHQCRRRPGEHLRCR